MAGAAGPDSRQLCLQKICKAVANISGGATFTWKLRRVSLGMRQRWAVRRQGVRRCASLGLQHHLLPRHVWLRSGDCIAYKDHERLQRCPCDVTTVKFQVTYETARDSLCNGYFHLLHDRKPCRAVRLSRLPRGKHLPFALLLAVPCLAVAAVLIHVKQHCARSASRAGVAVSTDVHQCAFPKHHNTLWNAGTGLSSQSSHSSSLSCAEPGSPACQQQLQMKSRGVRACRACHCILPTAALPCLQRVTTLTLTHVRRKEAQDELRKKLLQHKEVDAKVRGLREQAKELKVEYDKTEDDLKALQSVGQIIGEVLRQLDEERCKCSATCACALTCTNEGLQLKPFAVSDNATTAWQASTARHLVRSHRQGEQRAAVCGRLPRQGGQGQADAQHPRHAGHDHPHHHARPAPRGAPPPPPSYVESDAVCRRSACAIEHSSVAVRPRPIIAGTLLVRRWTRWWTTCCPRTPARWTTP
jgi:hypothetical protein